MWGGVGRRREGEGATSKGREGIGGKGRGKGEEGRGRESGRGERSASRGGGLTPLLLLVKEGDVTKRSTFKQ